MMALSEDRLWPRAGDWPAADGDGWDAAILGAPAFRTSLWPTGARATPAAIREALRRFSPTLLGPPPASVPGGLAAWELRTLVRTLSADRRVASADIVEVDATADAPDGRTVRLAALCVLEMLAGIHEREATT